MDDVFKIFVEQLRDGKKQDFDEVLDPAFLEINEEDLVFEEPVSLKGCTYLAENELLIKWTIKTKARMLCAICNKPVEVPLTIEDAYFSEPLSEIKTGVFSFKELLRETILLEVPLIAECEGFCPRRAEYTEFLKDPSKPESEEEGYHPFKNLDWKTQP